MSYSNESFEAFQKKLRQEIGQDSPLWDLRDCLFAEAFYGKSGKHRSLFSFPGGWVLLLFFLWLKQRRNFSLGLIPTCAEGASHFYFPSDRSNHIGRLLPMLENALAKGETCIAWFSAGPTSEFNGPPPELRSFFHDVTGAWTSHLKISDFREAARLGRILKCCLGEQINQSQTRAACASLVQFFAWRRFWTGIFRKKPANFVSTFEKGPIIKAASTTARAREVEPRRHGIHGLRPASLQANRATEHWSMTPGDQRFLSTRVPDYCQVTVKENPEAHDLAREIGVLDFSTSSIKLPLHFLVLGPGANASYTKEMRLADLAVIKQLQDEFGTQIRFRFRPHPSRFERFRCELLEAKIMVKDFQLRPLYEDLKWSHVVGSATSSLMLDWVHTGRKIFWIQAELRSICAVDELVEDGIGIHLDCRHGPSRLRQAIPLLKANNPSLNL